MEDGVVIQPVFALFVSDGMGPSSITFREVDKILYRFRRVLFVQTAYDYAFRSIEHCISARLPGHE